MKLQIHTSESADEVEKYLHGKHSLEAYYSANEQEIVGDWGGKGAEHLGLKGVVTNEAFGRLVHNLHHTTGEQMTERMREDRRPGFDMVWNVPKSVSLTYAYTKDERIIQAFRETVAEMMELAKKQAAVRVRTGNKNRNEDRVTEWLITAEHIHLTARPEDGYSDPHLHIHLYVPNISYDPVEKKFKALQMGRIHKMADGLEKMATKRFAEKLQAIGLNIVPTEHAFEIEGFDRDLVMKFSRRTMTIEKTAQRLGITDPAQKAKLAAVTRQNKIKDVKFSDFEPIWWGSLTPDEEKPFKAVQERLTLSRAMGLATANPAAELSIEMGPTQSRLGSRAADWAGEQIQLMPDGRRFSMNRATRPRAETVRNIEANDHDHRAIALALEHLLERNSTVTEFQIVAEASTNWCLKKTTVAGLWRALDEAPIVRCKADGWTWATTPEVLAEEDRLIKACRSGKGRFEPVNEFWKIRDEELNAQQQAAALLVLNSRDFITAIKGDPGVGKTRVLREIKAGAEAGMYKLIALAPRSSAAHEVLEKEGFENAQTVAHLLASPTAQDEARGAVWIVDEAALLSTREADRLIALADKLEARLVFIGDSGQHLPVGRGQAFRLLEEIGEMLTARITEIQRQRGEYRRLVELIIAKKTGEAIDLMEKMGDAHEMGREERRQALAEEYVAALERGETVGVVAPTHVERRDVMNAIRETLKAKGIIKADHSRKVMRDLRWTETQKSTPAEFKIGMRVQLDGQVEGFNLNEQLEVVGVRDDMVRVRSLHPQNTETRPLPLHMPEKLTVLDLVEEQLGERDVLRNLSWTKAEKSDAEHYEPGMVVQINAHLKGYALGEHLEVVRVDNDGVRAKSSTGRHKLLPLKYPGAFSVHEKDRIEICEGELIRVTANSRTKEGHRICNGSTYKVDYLANDGTIVLENSRRLDRDFKNLEWGYGSTSHGMQGQTFDRILVAQCAEMSAGATDLRQFLVSISRGRLGAKLYTNSLEWLRERVAYENKTMMATELMRGGGEKQRAETVAPDVAQEQRPLAAKLGQTDEPHFKPEQAEKLEPVQRRQPSVTHEEQENEMAMEM
jgi:conjugative relaxase-like TrwC/TraI family protein